MRGAVRRALFVLYYFPPSGGPGVQRGLKFVQYLPDYGWEPVVLTVPRDAHFPVRDESLCAEVPVDLIVRRTRCPEFYGIYRALMGQRGAAPLDIATHGSQETRGIARFLRWLRGALFVPDGRAAWKPFAVAAGTRMIRELGVDLIFSSGPPFTCHLIGRRLQQRSGLPWVADYRDPWTEATFYPPRPPCARRRDQRLESDCLHGAERSIVVGRGMASDFLQRYPDLSPERLVVIPNGYDASDFRDVPFASSESLRITHTGSVFAARSPQAFLDAVADLLRQEPGFAQRVRLTFAGRLDPQLQRQLARAPYDAITELPGYLPHAESIRLLRASSLLLLLIGSDAQARSMVTGKLFEYLASGVPILALGPGDGEAARLLRETGAGWVYEPHDREALRMRLREVWRTHQHTTTQSGAPHQPLQFGLQRRGSAIEGYSRRALTERLAALFDEVHGGRSRARTRRGAEASAGIASRASDADAKA
ncbi:MAG: glycosyltransferase [Candidatus Eisenbacteria bacterium]|nr:glycosyltransferase [Candidatus Eisenbacteria bacterium]